MRHVIPNYLTPEVTKKLASWYASPHDFNRIIHAAAPYIPGDVLEEIRTTTDANRLSDLLDFFFDTMPEEAGEVEIH